MNKMKLKLLVVGIFLLGVQGISALDPFNPENVEGFVKAVVRQARSLEKDERKTFLGRSMNDTDVKKFFSNKTMQEVPANTDDFFGEGHPWVVDGYPVLTPAALVVGYGNVEQIQSVFGEFSTQELNSRAFCAKPEGRIYTLAHMAVDPTMGGQRLRDNSSNPFKDSSNNLLQLVKMGVELDEVPKNVEVSPRNNLDPIIVATGLVGVKDESKYSIRSLLLVLGARPAHTHGTAFGLHPYLDPSQYDDVMANSFNFVQNQKFLVQAFIRVMEIDRSFVKPSFSRQEGLDISAHALLSQLVRESEECRRRAEEARRTALMFAGEI